MHSLQITTWRYSTLFETLTFLQAMKTGGATCDRENAVYQHHGPKK